MPKQVAKVFRIVSLGEELTGKEIAAALKKEIAAKSNKPSVFFTVTECTQDNHCFSSTEA